MEDYKKIRYVERKVDLMRLIDADALQAHFTDMQHYEKCAANFPDHRGELSTNWYCVEQALENAETFDAIVEVIPLEWLTKRMGEELEKEVLEKAVLIGGEELEKAVLIGGEELEKAVLIGGGHNALSRSLWNVIEYWRREAKADE